MVTGEECLQQLKNAKGNRNHRRDRKLTDWCRIQIFPTTIEWDNRRRRGRELQRRGKEKKRGKLDLRLLVLPKLLEGRRE